jgi:hypothetical protein
MSTDNSDFLTVLEQSLHLLIGLAENRIHPLYEDGSACLLHLNLFVVTRVN